MQLWLFFINYYYKLFIIYTQLWFYCWKVFVIKLQQYKTLSCCNCDFFSEQYLLLSSNLDSLTAFFSSNDFILIIRLVLLRLLSSFCVTFIFSHHIPNELFITRMKSWMCVRDNHREKVHFLQCVEAWESESGWARLGAFWRRIIKRAMGLHLPLSFVISSRRLFISFTCTMSTVV